MILFIVFLRQVGDYWFVLSGRVIVLRGKEALRRSHSYLGMTPHCWDWVIFNARNTIEHRLGSSSLSLSLTLKLTHSFALSLPHASTHTHSLFRSFSLTRKHTRSLSLSFFHSNVRCQNFKNNFLDNIILRSSIWLVESGINISLQISHQIAEYLTIKVNR